MPNSMSLKTLAVVVMLCGISLAAASAVTSDANTAHVKQIQLACVEQWDAVPAAEVNIPKLTKMQVIAGVEKYISTHKALRSWETEYDITWRQAPQMMPRTPRADSPRNIPELVKNTKAKMISNNGKWCYQSAEENENKTTGGKRSSSCFYASNGKLITMLQPDQKAGQSQVWMADKWNGISWTATIVDFMPWLPAQPVLARATRFPDFNDILLSTNMELLPWYTKVNDHICYVIEQTSTRQHPLFKTSQELETWKKNNPKEAELWLKAKDGLSFLIDQGAKIGDLRTVKATAQLAIDPKFDFAIVRWAQGIENTTPHVKIALFPQYETKYGDFREINKNYVPHEMAYTEYSAINERQKKVNTETMLRITSFAIDKTYPNELFEPAIPKGYSLTNVATGVVSNVGDSKEKLAVLSDAAKARDAFYAKLSEGQSPSLEASQWLNSKPIQLADHTGREIILHFWAIGCVPCMYEMPRLQEQYGHPTESSSQPLFISIHPFVEGKDLQRLQETIKKYGITFPVMVDSGGDPQWPIGKTHRKYQVDGWPTDLKIDNAGHFAGEAEKHLINASSRWVKNSDPNKEDPNSLPARQRKNSP